MGSLSNGFIEYNKNKPSFKTEGLSFCCFLILLVVPNMVFSGEFWYQTLHPMKWVVTLVPLCIMLFFAFIKSFAERARGFLWDSFSLIATFFLIFLSLQPLWIPISSWSTYLLAWFSFAALWLLYIITFNIFNETWLPWIFLSSGLAGAVSVFFAELQIHSLHKPFFFILQTPGHYIANTGQQNMLAFWLAICSLNLMFLFLYVPAFSKKGWDLPRDGILILLLAVTEWGLWNTTSRSAIFGIISGLLFMAIGVWCSGNKDIKRRALCIILIFFAIMTATVELNEGRIGTLKDKFRDIVENPASVGQRDSIWLTSWYMFRQHPFRGVGLGHYKWNYLKAQGAMLEEHPEKKWQYTYWAHNEFLQWLCETGVVGGALLFTVVCWWFCHFVSVLYKKAPLSLEALWGSSLVVLFGGTALWTRPFHRIEDAVWLAVALGVANRDILQEEFCVRFSLEKNRFIMALFSGVAVGGLIFLGHGLYSDRLIAKAFEEKNMALQMDCLNRASQSLMVRSLAQKELAHLLLACGEGGRDPELLAEGLNRMYALFQKEPHVKEFRVLLDWGIKLGKKDLVFELSRYLHPSVRGTVP